MSTAATAFNAWLDEFFASYFRHRPVNATFIGSHEFDDRLPDFSSRAAADVITEMESLLSRVRALPAEKMTEGEAMDRKLAESFLEIQLWEYRSSHFHRGNPCIYTGEAVFGVISLFLRPFATLRRRVEAAIARMSAAPAFLAQGRANLRQAPLAWTQRAIQECQGAVAFFGDGIDILIQQEAIADPRLRPAADRALAAFTDFQAYLERELAQRPAGACGCGEEVFGRLLHRGHFLKMSARAIEDLAKDQLEARRTELQTHAADFGATNWREVLKKLSDRHPPVDQYYARYRNLAEACRFQVEFHRLFTWPDRAVQFVPLPRWARRAAPFLDLPTYLSPTPYEDLPVVDYYVTPIEPEMRREEQMHLLRANNDSVIKVDHVIGRGGPGRHVQSAYALHSCSRMGQIASIECACRIAMLCGGTMADGWARYATDLMGEIGFLTPLEKYAENHFRLRAAAGALVDVRLHTGGWTLEESAGFYQQQLGMTADEARTEAVRNSMFPSTALMGLVGSHIIRELRRDLTARQGQAFDRRRFHDRLLSYGSVPVSLVAEAMRRTEGSH